jgi:hypothetical protein
MIQTKEAKYVFIKYRQPAVFVMGNCIGSGDFKNLIYWVQKYIASVSNLCTEILFWVVLGSLHQRWNANTSEWLKLVVNYIIMRGKHPVENEQTKSKQMQYLSWTA